MPNLPTNHIKGQPILAADVNALAADVNSVTAALPSVTASANAASSTANAAAASASSATAAVAAIPATYYTKDQVDAAIAKAIAASQVTDPPGPPVSPYVPRDVLNIGSGAGKNHFSVQVAPTGAASYVQVPMADIIGGYEENPYFYVVTDTGGVERVHFQARMDAPTTSGSAYPRCELREQDLDGSNMASNFRVGTHRCLGTSRIPHSGAVNPDVVVAQVHDGSRDRISIRLQAISSSNQTRALAIRVNGSQSAPGWNEGIAYVPNREFSWKIEGVDDAWQVSIDGTVRATVPVGGLSTTSTQFYFKAGCYNQSNDTIDAPTDYCAVELRQLMHWHTGWPTNLPFPVLN